MTSETKDSVLRRMTSDLQVPKPQPSVTAMLKLALEQASDALLGISLEALAGDCARLDRDEIGARLPQTALFAVLEGQVPGFLCLESALVGGIVEHQTIGRVLPGGGDADRKPTRVDAALVAPLIDGALERVTLAAEASEGVPWACGLAFGAMVSGRRALLLALPVRDYHVIAFDLQLSEGARQGRVFLGFGELPKAVDPEEDADNAAPAEGATVRAGVLSAPATLDAVIARMPMPLRALQSLKVGDVVNLPGDTVRRSWLEAKGTEHSIRVSLGQLNGFRAVRLMAGDGKPAGKSEAGEKIVPEAQDVARIANGEPASLGPEVLPPEPEVEPEPAAQIDDLDALLEVSEEGDLLTPV